MSTLLGSELQFMYDLSGIGKLLQYMVFISLVAIFIIEHSIKENKFICYGIFATLIVLIEMTLRDRSFLIFIMFMVTAYKINFDKLIRFDFKVRIFTFCMLVGLCHLGFINNYSKWFYGNTVLKYAHGFHHPNTYTLYGVIILLEWLVIRYRRMNVGEWIINAVCAYVLLKTGGGRTSVYAYIGVYILLILARLCPSIYRWKLSYIAFIAAAPLMALFSFAGVYLYSKGNAIFIKLNQVMTSRFSSAARFINDYGISLLGRKIETVSTRESEITGVASAILDNSYVRCAIVYGIVFLIVLIAMYIWLKIRCLQYDRPELALFALFFVLIGITESNMLTPLFNITLFSLLGLQVNQGNLILHKKIRYRLSY